MVSCGFVHVWCVMTPCFFLFGASNELESIYTTFVVASCAFKIHRESEPALGKPVLISILAFPLVFHAVNLWNAAVSEKTQHPFPPKPDAE